MGVEPFYEIDAYQLKVFYSCTPTSFGSNVLIVRRDSIAKFYTLTIYKDTYVMTSSLTHALRQGFAINFFNDKSWVLKTPHGLVIKIKDEETYGIGKSLCELNMTYTDWGRVYTIHHHGFMMSNETKIEVVDFFRGWRGL